MKIYSNYYFIKLVKYYKVQKKFRKQFLSLKVIPNVEELFKSSSISNDLKKYLNSFEFYEFVS